MPDGSPPAPPALPSLHERYNELLRTGYDKAYRLALSRVGNPEDAAELVQEAFLRLYVAQSWLGPETRLMAYLGATIVTRAKDLHRRRFRQSAALALNTTVVPLALFQGSNMTKELTGLEKQLEEALATLTQRQRDVLMLTVIEHYEYAEVAEFLGLTVSQVRNAHHRGRLKLKEHPELKALLPDEDEDDEDPNGA